MAELRGGMRRGGWSGFGILEGIRKRDVSGKGTYLEKGRGGLGSIPCKTRSRSVNHVAVLRRDNTAPKCRRVSKVLPGTLPRPPLRFHEGWE